MSGLARGRYRIRFAASPEDVFAAQALRYRCFRAPRGDGSAPQAGEGSAAQGGAAAEPQAASTESIDADDFDAKAAHVLVEESDTGRLVCCFRLMHFRNGSEIASSYSAQFYELSALGRYEGPMLELGRFCIDPAAHGADVLRVAWGALADYIDRHGIELLFGCSSFKGTEAEAYLDAFAVLKDRHIAPRRWLPRVKAPRVFRFARSLRLRKPNLKVGMRTMPPLLRTYLVMGGWVSDHAVVDGDLGTLHVFTGLEVNAVPSERARFFRAAKPLETA
ncbi:GNAT family N-acetyltransferase [soil metagenome]